MGEKGHFYLMRWLLMRLCKRSYNHRLRQTLAVLGSSLLTILHFKNPK